MADRIDHRARIQPPSGDAPEDLPQVSPELAQWLAHRFRRAPPQVATNLDSAIAIATEQARQAGREEVVRDVQNLAAGTL